MAGGQSLEGDDVAKLRIVDGPVAGEPPRALPEGDRPGNVEPVVVGGGCGVGQLRTLLAMSCSSPTGEPTRWPPRLTCLGLLYYAIARDLHRKIYRRNPPDPVRSPGGTTPHAPLGKIRRAPRAMANPVPDRWRGRGSLRPADSHVALAAPSRRSSPAPAQDHRLTARPPALSSSQGASTTEPRWQRIRQRDTWDGTRVLG
jgi:hypothetical protein